jgi:hypothetical protein
MTFRCLICEKIVQQPSSDEKFCVINIESLDVVVLREHKSVILSQHFSEIKQYINFNNALGVLSYYEYPEHAGLEIKKNSAVQLSKK